MCAGAADRIDETGSDDGYDGIWDPSAAKDWKDEEEGDDGSGENDVRKAEDAHGEDHEHADERGRYEGEHDRAAGRRPSEGWVECMWGGLLLLMMIGGMFGGISEHVWHQKSLPMTGPSEPTPTNLVAWVPSGWSVDGSRVGPGGMWGATWMESRAHVVGDDHGSGFPTLGPSVRRVVPAIGAGSTVSRRARDVRQVTDATPIAGRIWLRLDGNTTRPWDAPIGHVMVQDRAGRAAIQASAPPLTDQEVREAAWHLLQTNFAKCGEFYYLALQKLGAPASRREVSAIVQFKDLTLQVNPSPLTQMDQRQGVTWKGSIAFHAAAYRTFAPARSSWSPWQEGIGDYAFASFSLEQKHGQWTSAFTNPTDQQLWARLTPPDWPGCAAVPHPDLRRDTSAPHLGPVARRPSLKRRTRVLEDGSRTGMVSAATSASRAAWRWLIVLA